MNSEMKRNRIIAKIVIWSLLGLILLSILILMAIASNKPMENAEIPEEKALPVSVMDIQAETIDNSTRIPGRLEAFLDVTVPVENAGTVTEILVDKGDIVTNGQVLLKVDARLWEDRLKQAEIDLRESAKDLKRWQEMHKSGAVSKDAFEEYQTGSESAEIARNNALINLEKCIVTSPIDGYVNNRFADTGEYVNEGAPVFQILQLDTMKLVLDIPERDITAIQLGAPLPFTINGLPGSTFTATTSFISAQAAKANNSFAAEAVVPNPDNQLKAGMIAQVELSVGKLTDAIVIPLAAIVPDKGDHVAYTADGDRAQRSVVIIDDIRGSSAIVGSGIESGDKLVIEGHRSLTDGALIEIMPTATATAE